MVAVNDNLQVISQHYREEFAESMTDFLIRYDLDGADIDWEYPAVPDTDNFILLLQALRQSLKASNKDLSVAVNPCGSASIGYDVPRIFETVDFVNGMFYDFFSGKWGNNTANHGNYWNSKSSYSAIGCYNKFLEKGAIPEKFVIGIPSYSRNFQLNDPEVNGIGALATFKNFGLTGEIPATLLTLSSANGWPRALLLVAMRQSPARVLTPSQALPGLATMTPSQSARKLRW
jgi:chitinase